jgi:hypothetical protein
MRTWRSRLQRWGVPCPASISIGTAAEWGESRQETGTLMGVEEEMPMDIIVGTEEEEEEEEEEEVGKTAPWKDY